MTEKSGVLFGAFVEMDGRARELLWEFYGWLRSPEGAGLSDTMASALAHHADRYLRDFLVDIMEEEPEATNADSVRRYLANWYIINTLEPTAKEIEGIAEALSLFHRWACAVGLIDEKRAAEVEAAMTDSDYFLLRLESFWNLDDKGISPWRAVHDYRKSSFRS